VIHLARVRASEAVDVVTDGEFAYLCGGFGATVVDVRNPAAARSMGSVTNRCQRTALGPPHPAGGRIVYFSHHGDSWVRTPFLATFHRTAGGEMRNLARIADAETLFEGQVWVDGHLYVAVHEGGLVAYTTGADGVPAEPRVVEGFDNAWQVAHADGHLYVADGIGGIKVVSLADPAAPRVLASFPTTGAAWDVAARGDRVYVAMGSDGIDVFDVAAPADLRRVGHIDAGGSVGAVAVDGGLLTAAAWSHVAVYDADTLRPIATEDLRPFPAFDQVFGVAVRGDLLFAAEWNALHVLQYRPGYVGPDITVSAELLEFPPDREAAQVLVLGNRGELDLEITDVRTADADRFTVDKRRLTIPPGGVDAIEVTYHPTGDEGLESRLTLDTNDPDASQSPLDLFLVAEESQRLRVGDAIGPELGFLDPSGAGQVEALRGRVTVLAYFALF